ncbi:hypothetical protein [Algoriphagus sp. CAU 1675]|uniref:hypothetical protein n=1 Tax=Algoriphagus sp. CAU 1675 TaxID=3032597 RepID=UPI0023DBAA5A|nr:hypothetical protein [Algoriphagus sp. CAU 1675]MDF2157603.1 hypothetical protein [Algoriphagus sp. CAU 1675]
MQKKLLIGIMVLAILGSAAYWIFSRLGGNNPIAISLVEKSPEALSGILFKGTPQDPKLGESFQKVEDQKSLHPGTFLHTIYEVEPAGKLDTMMVFVGINHLLVGDEFETRTFQEQRYLLAKITGNNWVMPGPEKVKAKIQAFADSAQVQLSGIFIDKIISEKEVHVLAPIR